MLVTHKSKNPSLTMKVSENIKSDISIEVQQDRLPVLKQDSFHESIKFVIVMAQVFGVMPLHNISNGIDDVTFKWRSIRVLYSLFNTAATFISAGFWIVKFSVHGLIMDQTVQMLFYICNFLASLRLIKLAHDWSHFLREWSFVEMSMRGYVNESKTKKKFIILTAAFMGLGAVEHLFFILNGVYQSKECAGYSENPIKAYFEVSFQNYFTFIEYNFWIGVVIKFANTITTFTWIFTDLFITLISIAMTARFKQIVRRLKNNKVMHEKFWREIRLDYQKLYHLWKSVEENLSFLVLVSYMLNIFFLCVQLYNSLSERSGIIETTYFFLSFGFLVSRLLTVSMYAAWLNEEARTPLEFLYAVPTEHYCTEVCRFIEQICTTPIGITGSGFFLVTKNFLLQMAGTIVTFELMLFQFAPVNVYDKPQMSYGCLS
ncbi:hypothetical protein JTB14_034415 [Gonioctena quinquepunctata]|nr:hypothetical protein JTB14_034415 [Gonioctena quinquepunctata]